MNSSVSKDILTLRITDLARGGAGVARDANGRVTFVPLTAPGDLVHARVVEADRRYAQGELVEILEPSPERVEPPCPVFGKCGGCQWQHLPYDLQWKTKVSGVVHALARAGVTETPAFEELPADPEHRYHYRNRVQLRGDGDQLGFFAPATKQLVPTNQCEIARVEINAEWNSLRAEGAKLARPYKVEVEVRPHGEVKTYWNARHGAGGFRQVHDDQNRKLQSWVSGALTVGRSVLDLYGGSGNLSEPLTHLKVPPREIHCVDISAPLKSELITYHRSEVVPWLIKQSRKAEKNVDYRSAIIDPPRIGLAGDFNPVADSLERLRVTEIVFVGCDPDSFARDVSRFIRRGWSLIKVGVLDLFPQTAHVESLALLRFTSPTLTV